MYNTLFHILLVYQNLSISAYFVFTFHPYQIYRKDVQNLRQENELFERQLSASEHPHRESASGDGCIQNLSSCHIDGAKNNASRMTNALESKISEESDPDGRF